MAAKPRSPAQVRHDGMRALLERLGPSDTIRFLQSHDQGAGDYTRDRRQWLKDWTVPDAVRAIREHEQRRAAGVGARLRSVAAPYATMDATKAGAAINWLLTRARWERS